MVTALPETCRVTQQSEEESALEENELFPIGQSGDLHLSLCYPSEIPAVPFANWGGDRFALTVL